ncbi:HisA/HisF-related TIM barrel protein [Piscinibacter sp.]|uniref:HisA/HisF-related TIM barrel protein n=1 Tax=Piscinibacter sp. TaxID=1903157 RepID=UPI0039E37BDA
MLLIPVIDLMRGHAVRALRGERASYKPVVSTLCEGSEPLAVARALCAHCASTRLYAADLDALTGGQAQVAALRRILRAMPELELWLDAGFADRAAAEALRERIGPGAERVVPVFASESLRSREALAACGAGREAGVLSLDRRDGRRLDAAGAWESPMLWPSRVIVMTLERVGAAAGPDLATLREVQAKSPATRLVGAGGIRDEHDLDAARAAGAHAWLVASALHDGRLPAAARA